MKMKIKIVAKNGKYVAYKVINKMFSGEKLEFINSFDFINGEDVIVQYLRDWFFNTIKKELNIVKSYTGDSFEYLVYNGSTLISRRNTEYGSAENLKTPEEVEKHIKNWYAGDLIIEFPLVSYNNEIRIVKTEKTN